MVHAGNVPIVNFGSIKFGHFGIVKLCKSPNNNKWVFKSSEFLNLNIY